MNKSSELNMIEYIEISGIKTIVRLPDNYLCGRKYKVIFINDGEIVNNIEQPDNQIYVGLIPKNRLAAYTPWPYKAIREGAEDFGGECREYHNQLVGEIVPYLPIPWNEKFSTNIMPITGPDAIRARSILTPRSITWASLINNSITFLLNSR